MSESDIILSLARCNYSECDRKEDCMRYLEEEEVNYVNFKALMKEEKCNWFFNNRKNEIIESE